MKLSTFNPGHEQKPNSKMHGHEYGDYHLMRAFVNAVAHNDPTRISSGHREALESHLMVFAAERSRRTSQVVTMK